MVSDDCNETPIVVSRLFPGENCSLESLHASQGSTKLRRGIYGYIRLGSSAFGTPSKPHKLVSRTRMIAPDDQKWTRNRRNGVALLPKLHFLQRNHPAALH